MERLLVRPVAVVLCASDVLGKAEKVEINQTENRIDNVYRLKYISFIQIICWNTIVF